MGSINVLVAEDDGSSFYRLKEPARAAAAAGADVRVYHFGDDRIWDADTWVVNRPIRQQQVDLVAWLLNEGKRVIVDIDDDFHHLVPEHSMYGGPEHLRVGKDSFLPLAPLMEACAMASAVTVTTPALLDIYGHGHGHVVENHIPAWYLDVERDREHGETYIGWTGSVGSHPNDLFVTDGGVAKAIAKVKGRIAHVGPEEQTGYVAEALGYTGPAARFGWQNARRYPRAIAQFDIGIVPLEQVPFNDGKSWLKGLEYAALGVPFVASPVADYRKLNNLGAGLLASTRNEWSGQVQQLARDADFHAEQAHKGKEVAATLTVEGNVEKWLSIWDD